ncbi:uncharacterized, partial [Tachysurus ichikawai]
MHSVRRVHGAVSPPHIGETSSRAVNANGQNEARAGVREGGDAAMRLIYAQ